MWIRKAPYKLKDSLPEIVRHDELPTGCIELAKIKDTTNPTMWFFVQNQSFLSILNMQSRLRNNSIPYYHCFQQDFPLEFLSWFPSALVEFQKPPVEGGLHVGAMTTPDIEVGGEMLCVQRASGIDREMGGYAVMNRSRCQKGRDPETSFTPHEVIWASRFLYDGGLLNLIKNLGEKFERGEL